MKGKGNKGTILVEMCVVMPIVVVVVMMAISMMIVQINQSAAVGTLYVVSCNRSDVLTAAGAAEKELAACLEQSASSYMQLAEDIAADASYKKAGKHEISGLAGTLTLSVAYKEMHPGLAMLLKKDDAETSVTITKQIRDTEDNLRRWQLYGSIL